MVIKRVHTKLPFMPQNSTYLCEFCRPGFDAWSQRSMTGLDILFIYFFLKISRIELNEILSLLVSLLEMTYGTLYIFRPGPSGRSVLWLHRGGQAVLSERHPIERHQEHGDGESRFRCHVSPRTHQRWEDSFRHKLFCISFSLVSLIFSRIRYRQETKWEYYIYWNLFLLNQILALLKLFSCPKTQYVGSIHTSRVCKVVQKD